MNTYSCTLTLKENGKTEKCYNPNVPGSYKKAKVYKVVELSGDGDPTLEYYGCRKIFLRNRSLVYETEIPLLEAQNVKIIFAT